VTDFQAFRGNIAGFIGCEVLLICVLSLFGELNGTDFSVTHQVILVQDIYSYELHLIHGEETKQKR